jgi:acetolactate decarboxylase
VNSRKKLVLAAATLVAVVLFAAFYENSLINPVQKQNMLYQVSAFNVFSAGNYEGNTTYAELAKHGDFGIGTLNGLNGEMIALNGKFYQIPTDGDPRQIISSEKTPYATVTFFKSNQSFQVANVTSYSLLTEDINSTLTNYNAIYAIKVHGFFDLAKTRSVPAQSEPYPTIAEAVKNQTVFVLNGVVGTAVGFYFPNSMDGVDVAGYHLHFLSDDHLSGGHLLECNVKNATVEIDQINNYYLQIP